MKNISEMKTSEMIEEYNSLTGKSIKKFSSREAGEKQLTKAREESLSQSSPSIKRSVGAQKSWQDDTIASARSKKERVQVTGKSGQVSEYRSVKAAFLALGLPIAKHIKFRMALKEGKTAEFGNFKFEIVNK